MKGVYNKTLYDIGKVLLAAVIAAAIFVWIYGYSVLDRIPECTFETITGLYCPGCGGSRAFIALCKGQFVRSFMLHPAVPCGVLIYTVFMVRMFLLKHFGIGREKDGRIVIFIYIWIGIIMVQWVVKLVLLMRYGIKTL